MASKYRIDPARLSTVLTSCGRFDLLEKTVSSFLEHFDAEQVIIAEDSEKAEEAAEFARKFTTADVRVNRPKLGQLRSIDQLYATLTTPYVVHLEDDWGFTRSLDLDRVIEFLEARADIACVCIAHRVYDPRYAKGAQKEHHGGIDYLVWDLDAHPKWFSYSFNPSVARMAFWKEAGPFAKFVTEEALSQFCKEQGMRIAMVVPGVADHIGDDRHAPDPFQPARAKTLFSRLKRSAAKRWARLTDKDKN
jgi:Glycosyl transferase family 2